MAQSAARDGALSLSLTQHVLSASQAIIAQWNHNEYTDQKIYGHYEDDDKDVGPSTMRSEYTSTISKTFSNNAVQSLTTISTPFNDADSNVVRIMFDARISAVSGLSEPVDEFALMVSTGTDEFNSTFSIEMTEGYFEKKEIIYVSNVNSSEIFSSLKLSLYPINEISSGYISVEIKNIYITYVGERDLRMRQADRLGWVFKPNRPGDQILENGLLTRLNPPTKYHIATDLFTDKKKNPVLFPTLISPFNSEIYYIAAMNGERGKTFKNFFVEYDNAVPTNQIYIKTQDQGHRIDGKYLNAKNYAFRVYIKENGAWNGTAIYEEIDGDPSTPFLTNGSIILQYDGADWTEGYYKAGIPKMSTLDGSFSNTKNIEGIRIQLRNNNTGLSRVIEISPRLALNLSDFLISSNHEKSIDGGNYAIPVGLSNINTGDLTLENLPRTSGGEKYQIFDNNSNSTLNGLIRSGVKFTVYTRIYNTKTNQSFETKDFTMFADDWNQDDLTSVQISLSDGARLLQNTPCSDFLVMGNYHPSMIGTIQKAVEYLLQTSGFSDYDVDSLQEVSDRLETSYLVKIPIFFAKREDNVWDTLTKLLLGYQISCFFDENGILQFRDIVRESPTGTFYADSSSYFKISNTKSGDILPNISSIKIENKKNVGEIAINYRQLSETNSLFSVNGKTVDNTAVGFNSRVDISTMYAKTNPWEISTEPGGLICANIISDIEVNANTIQLGDWTGPASTRTNAGKPRFITGFSGYGIIEGEIVSWNGLQYKFSPQLAGFPIYETVRSTEELNDSVARRMSFMAEELEVTGVTRNVVSRSSRIWRDGRLVTVTRNVVRMLVATNVDHKLSVGSPIRITLYNTDNIVIMDKNFTVDTISSATQFHVVLGGIAFPSETVGTESVVTRDISKISYQVTGKLMNVRRGLFGTNADYHYSTTRSDPSMFVGTASNSSTPGRMQLNYKYSSIVEPDNSYNLAIPTRKGNTTYIGFLKKDKEEYDEYRFVVTPRSDLDGLGIFLGASVANTGPTAGSAIFMSNNTGTYANGIFIEMYSSSQTSVKYGVQVRGAVSRSSRIQYYSNQKLLNDNFDVRVVGTGSAAKTVRFPPKQQVIRVRVIRSGTRTGKMLLYINGRQVRFTKTGENITTPYLPLPTTWNRRNKTFGMFVRNDTANSAININNILAGTEDQTLDREITWEEVGAPSTRSKDLDFLITNQHGYSYRYGGRMVNGFSERVRPFIFRYEPVIRGLAIFDVKYSGDAPFFDLVPFGPQGTNGTQIFPENAIQKSCVVGTPFRGRIAYRNTTGEVAPLVGGENYVKAKILGRSINIASDKKLNVKIPVAGNPEKVEISCPWSAGNGVIQKILIDLAKRVNYRNKIYEIDMYGSPALTIGDYVKVTHTDKSISNKIAVVQKISQSFDSGGISTKLILRDANPSN